MPFHDLNVIRPPSNADLSKTLAFLSELGYGVVAISLNVTGKLPQAPPAVSVPVTDLPQGLKVLTRMTLTISDPSQNHRLTSLQPHYHLLALRPTNEKAFSLCCTNLECDIISLDLSQRLPFILKFKTISAALQRGIRFEICYSPGITAGNDARRNLISGATALNRATRGRGMIISSEARTALACRGPWDVINLAQLWGLARERCKEALCEEASKVVRLAGLKRTSYKGVVDVINGNVQPGDQAGGQKRHTNLLQPEVKQSLSVKASPSVQLQMSTPKQPHATAPATSSAKRKSSSTTLNEPAPVKQINADGKPLSNRKLKKEAKRARLAAGNGTADVGLQQQAATQFPIQHESLAKDKG